MTAEWQSIDSRQWKSRIEHAEAVRTKYAIPEASEQEDAIAKAWLGSIDKTAYVGSRHHTVPRFLLQRWADKNGRVQVYRRIEETFVTSNIGDLAVKDFYTVVDEEGRKDSSIESLLGQVEAGARPVIDDILNPFLTPRRLVADELAQLAQFASFQSIRTARRRREIELHTEWYAKTMARGRMSDAELQAYTVTPHQNQSIQFTTGAADRLFPLFACRPVAIVHIDRPLLLTCDEPVVLNSPAAAFHVEDCFLTDAQIDARIRRARRRARKARQPVADKDIGRVVHLTSTKPMGHGVAEEILLAISPRAALLWGPLGDHPAAFSAAPEWLVGADAERFAAMANSVMVDQALDWIVGAHSDKQFRHRDFPPLGPLMRVCDGSNAASIALNEAPDRFRPHRLWVPEPSERGTPRRLTWSAPAAASSRIRSRLL